MLNKLGLLAIDLGISPRAPGGREGRSPRMGGGGDPIAVERASARRGVGRQPLFQCRLKQRISLPYALLLAVIIAGLVHDLIRRFHFGFPVSGKGEERCHLVSALISSRIVAVIDPQSFQKVVPACLRSRSRSSKLFHLAGVMDCCLKLPADGTVRVDSRLGFSKACGGAPRACGLRPPPLSSWPSCLLSPPVRAPCA